MPFLTDALYNAIITRQHEESYRVYVTDCLYALTRWTGNKLNKRYYDMLHPEPVDTRSGDEIARDRLKAFGIEVVT